MVNELDEDDVGHFHEWELIEDASAALLDEADPSL